MRSLLGERAIVIGGSLAGLMAARVLADHFDHVTVLERDHVEDRPALRKSIPQGSHAHVLLLGGQQAMSRLYPGFVDRLLSLGTVRVHVGREFVVLTPTGKAYSFGGAVREARDLGITFHYQSRGLLEHCVRQCTLESPNVSFEGDCIVRRPIFRDGRVRGVICGRDGDIKPLVGDLVVDAGGRGSRAQGWLRQVGFAPPEETTVGVDFAYSSARFVAPDYAEPAQVFAALGPGPDYPKAAYLVPLEDGVRLLTLGGRFGDYPPTDEAGFLAFAKSLHTPKIHEIVMNAERVSEITHHSYPTAFRRHYERMPTFPDGFLVIGDALCSFNPVYGQGMSSAALQAEALQHVLNERAEGPAPLEGLAPAFFTKAAEVITTPWLLATISDFAYPQTRGVQPPGLEESGRYFAAVEALSADDAKLQALIVEVFSLAKPLSALSEEPLRSRVLAKMQTAPIASVD
ncbi:MAG TPA: hypothetical protein VKS22_06525 [Candidatus Binataceae bacterium]|nr:hypothetical protein [Candidatus Binataceae bacterium]